MSIEDIKSRLAEYSKFIDDVLDPQFVVERNAAKKVQDEIDDYSDLRGQLRQVQRQAPPVFETDVDLGHKAVFCRAVVRDPANSKVFVHAGMGFHVELAIPEALDFVQKRMDFLETHKLKKLKLRMKDIGSHMEASQAIIAQLERELHHG